MSELSLEGMSQESINGLALLAKGLSQNQNTRDEFLGLTKRANPELSIPEVDIPLKMQGLLTAEREKREALERQIQESEVRNQVKERRETMMRDKKLNADQVQEVEKLMVDRGIMNHDTAADFYLSQQKAAAPTPSLYSTSHSVPKVDAKNFNGNINQWARNEASQLIGDIRAGRVTV